MQLSLMEEVSLAFTAAVLFSKKHAVVLVRICLFMTELYFSLSQFFDFTQCGSSFWWGELFAADQSV